MSEKPMTLAEGAERFDRLARLLKDNQLAQTHGKPAAPPAKPALSEAFVQSPDEAWAKKYMTQCIGPVCFTQTADAAGFAKFPAEPPAPAAPAASHVLEPAVRPAKPAPKPSGEPIGRVIGKPARRSLFARLFSRP